MNRQQLYHIALWFMLVAGPVGQALAQGSGDLPPVTKSKPAPRGRTSAPKTNSGAAGGGNAAESKSSTLTRRPANTPQLVFNQAVSASLEAQSSGRLAAGNYYNEYLLAAKASDLLMIQFQAENPALMLRIYDQARAELPIVKDSMTGDYRFDTPTGTVPADGEYRVRILNTGEDRKAEGAYTLKFVRSGMTEAAYEAQLQKIASGFKASDAANVDATLKQLEQLIAEDANQAGAYELLGVIYLNHKHDPAQAATQMEKALKLGGAGLFKIEYDSRWRRPKRMGQNFNWEEPKSAWLRIHEGKAILAEANNPDQNIFALPGVQIRSIERSSNPAVLHLQVLPRRTYQFSPASKNAAETELIIRLMQTYVIKRSK